MRRLSRVILPVAMLLAVSGPAQAATAIDDVHAVDGAQRQMVAAGDVAGLEALAHANLRVNAPGIGAG